MKVALIDNGSVEAAAHEGLRVAAAAIGARTGATVEAVSWRHSDRIDPAALRGGPAATLEPWIRAQVSRGERDFLFIPFFISSQGAIGSSLRRDLDGLAAETGGFAYAVTEGLASGGALPVILADRVRSMLEQKGLGRPALIVVDHGGPSKASASIRDRVAAEVGAALSGVVGPVRAASMESPEGPEFAFNRPLLAELLREPGFSAGDVVIAPLFLLPGRHAGRGGDLESIAAAAQAGNPLLRCHFTELVGSHPLAIETLASALERALNVGTHP